jgi:hypothetical protein
VATGQSVPPVAFAPTAIDRLALYTADWSEGIDGWPSTSGWSAAAGMLHNDGSDFGDANWDGGLWNLNWVTAPIALPPNVREYLVEAEIRVSERPACGSFGLVLHGVYQVGLHDCQAGTPPVMSIRSRDPELLANAPMTTSFDPSANWYAYRVEVREGEIRALVNGELITSADRAPVTSHGNSFDPAQVGLWNDHTELNVRVFRVRALPPLPRP